jgi:Cupin-like domain
MLDIVENYDDFFQHVKSNVPCVIRNAFANIDEMTEYCNNKLTKYRIGTVDAYKSKKIPPLKTPIVDRLRTDERILVDTHHRVWKHKKGNLTQWHFDANGADLLNISVVGSKDFYLAAPDSFLVFPLSGVCPPIHFKEIIRYRLEAGDILYLPAYWFHKVITLEESLNVNVAFYLKNRMNESNRNSDLHDLHFMFQTKLWVGNGIREVHRPKHHFRAIVRGFAETLPIALFLYVLRLTQFYAFVCALSVSIAILLTCNEDAMGLFEIIAFFVAVTLIAMEVVVEILKQHGNNDSKKKKLF